MTDGRHKQSIDCTEAIEKYNEIIQALPQNWSVIEYRAYLDVHFPDWGGGFWPQPQQYVLILSVQAPMHPRVRVSEVVPSHWGGIWMVDRISKFIKPPPRYRIERG